MADIVCLTVVGSQGEADVICSLLRAYKIKCRDRMADSADSLGTWREILISEDNLEAAREILAARPAD